MSVLTFLCDGCETQKNFAKDFVFMTTTKEGKGPNLRFCRTCRTVRVSFPDVYFDGKPEENLADDPVTGRPRIFASKGEKAAYLRSKGIMEAGDNYHGAPTELYKNQLRKAVDGRHEVQMALKKVKEMGKDQRHQEYLRIVKEGEKRGR